ncbi:hypothetical protein EVAR_82819_1 [Eumeta japonica]|uniref:Uncharacterized protein n=1 Tax=Eumeta variegata TaxID=151549 RepID=A0A4C1V3Z1_EUMVA|nr:hypothetical protein EVAR_82819_1 [Eumeta japonica]
MLWIITKSPVALNHQRPPCRSIGLQIEYGMRWRRSRRRVLTTPQGQPEFVSAQSRREKKQNKNGTATPSNYYSSNEPARNSDKQLSCATIAGRSTSGRAPAHFPQGLARVKVLLISTRSEPCTIFRLLCRAAVFMSRLPARLSTAARRAPLAFRNSAPVLRPMRRFSTNVGDRRARAPHRPRAAARPQRRRTARLFDADEETYDARDGPLR